MQSQERPICRRLPRTKAQHLKHAPVHPEGLPPLELLERWDAKHSVVQVPRDGCTEQELSLGMRAMWATDCGMRRGNEDRATIVGSLQNLCALHGSANFTTPGCCVSVFDGHMGCDVVDPASALLHHYFASSLSTGVPVDIALRSAFSSLQSHLLKSDTMAGTTATTLVVAGDVGYVANVGDSKAVLVEKRQEGDEAVPVEDLTAHHHVSNPAEVSLVRRRGGEVIEIMGTPMVNGRSQVTRALGNPALEGVLGRRPDIASFAITDATDFVVMASDGLWDVFSSREAAEFVSQARDELMEEDTESISTLDTSESIPNSSIIAEALVSEAVERGSSDNVTATIIFFYPSNGLSSSSY